MQLIGYLELKIFLILILYSFFNFASTFKIKRKDPQQSGSLQVGALGAKNIIGGYFIIRNENDDRCVAYRNNDLVLDANCTLAESVWESTKGQTEKVTLKSYYEGKYLSFITGSPIPQMTNETTGYSQFNFKFVHNDTRKWRGEKALKYKGIRYNFIMNTDTGLCLIPQGDFMRQLSCHTKKPVHLSFEEVPFNPEWKKNPAIPPTPGYFIIRNEDDDRCVAYRNNDLVLDANCTLAESVWESPKGQTNNVTLKSYYEGQYLSFLDGIPIPQMSSEPKGYSKFNFHLVHNDTKRWTGEKAKKYIGIRYNIISNVDTGLCLMVNGTFMRQLDCNSNQKPEHLSFEEVTFNPQWKKNPARTPLDPSTLHSVFFEDFKKKYEEIKKAIRENLRKGGGPRLPLSTPKNETTLSKTPPPRPFLTSAASVHRDASFRNPDLFKILNHSAKRKRRRYV